MKLPQPIWYSQKKLPRLSDYPQWNSLHISYTLKSCSHNLSGTPYEVPSTYLILPKEVTPTYLIIRKWMYLHYLVLPMKFPQPSWYPKRSYPHLSDHLQWRSDNLQWKSLNLSDYMILPNDVPSTYLILPKECPSTYLILPNEGPFTYMIRPNEVPSPI